jgi:hypothetical protein
LLEGEQLDETDLIIKGNLAHAYLLSGEIDKAKLLYIKYKNQNVTATKSWVNMVEEDFAAFEDAGLPIENFKIIIDSIK